MVIFSSASCHHQDGRGNTALHFATGMANQIGAAILTAASADLCLMDADNAQNSIQMAARKGLLS